MLDYLHKKPWFHISAFLIFPLLTYMSNFVVRDQKEIIFVCACELN
jgi:hypothetical protein